MNGGRGKKIETGLTTWVHLIVSDESNGWLKRKCVCVFMHVCRVKCRRVREKDKYFHTHLLINRGYSLLTHGCMHKTYTNGERT